MSASAPASASSLLAASRRRFLVRLRFATALAIELPLVALFVAAVLLYRETFQDAEHKLQASTRVAQEHALRLIDTNEMLLARTLDVLGEGSDAEWLARGAELHERLKAMAKGLPQVQGVFVNGADGRMVGTNVTFPPPRQIDYSDRESIVAHRSGTGPRLFITEQLVSRATGERFFDMSRRRVFADGTYAGSVHVSLRPEYFDIFWQEMAQATPGLRLSLVRADGRLVARWPGGVPEAGRMPPGHPAMQAIAEGRTQATFDAESAFDSIPGITSIRRLGEHPVYVIATFDRKDVLEAWVERAGLLSIFVIPLAGALGWMAWLGFRRTRDELAALDRLEEESSLRQRAELALAQSQKLETAGRLAGGVAHELNNLLMIVASHVHLLRQHKPPAASATGLATIDRAVGSGKRLTRQLLALSGRQLFAPERVQLQERLPAALALLRPALPASIELAVDVAPDTAPIVVDPEEFELALVNLALNARDAMPKGGRLSLAARNALPTEPVGLGGERVVVEVTDTGGGIDPAILGRVREPLFTTKPAGVGSGLGLTQVQALCTASGGSLDIDSRLGQGTCVRLSFPRAPASDAGRPGKAASPVSRLECAVLLVEDDEAVARATAEVLESLGCTVRHAADGAAALQAIGEAPVDVVVSDVDMPGTIDGIELASRLERRRPALPVVLITGHASRLAQANSLRLEALAKPCSPAALHEAIRKALRAPRRAAN